MPTGLGRPSRRTPRRRTPVRHLACSTWNAGPEPVARATGLGTAPRRRRLTRCRGPRMPVRAPGPAPRRAVRSPTGCLARVRAHALGPGSSVGDATRAAAGPDPGASGPGLRRGDVGPGRDRQGLLRPPHEARRRPRVGAPPPARPSTPIRSRHHPGIGVRAHDRRAPRGLSRHGRVRSTLVGLRARSPCVVTSTASLAPGPSAGTRPIEAAPHPRDGSAQPVRARRSWAHGDRPPMLLHAVGTLGRAPVDGLWRDRPPLRRPSPRPGLLEGPAATAATRPARRRSLVRGTRAGRARTDHPGRGRERGGHGRRGDPWAGCGGRPTHRDAGPTGAPRPGGRDGAAAGRGARRRTPRPPRGSVASRAPGPRAGARPPGSPVRGPHGGRAPAAAAPCAWLPRPRVVGGDSPGTGSTAPRSGSGHRKAGRTDPAEGRVRRSAPPPWPTVPAPFSGRPTRRGPPPHRPFSPVPSPLGVRGSPPAGPAPSPDRRLRVASLSPRPAGPGTGATCGGIRSVARGRAVSGPSRVGAGDAARPGACGRWSPHPADASSGERSAGPPGRSTWNTGVLREARARGGVPADRPSPSPLRRAMMRRGERGDPVAWNVVGVVDEGADSSGLYPTTVAGWSGINVALEAGEEVVHRGAIAGVQVLRWEGRSPRVVFQVDKKGRLWITDRRVIISYPMWAPAEPGPLEVVTVPGQEVGRTHRHLVGHLRLTQIREVGVSYDRPRGLLLTTTDATEVEDPDRAPQVALHVLHTTLGGHDTVATRILHGSARAHEQRGALRRRRVAAPGVGGPPDVSLPVGGWAGGPHRVPPPRPPPPCGAGATCLRGGLGARPDRPGRAAVLGRDGVDGPRGLRRPDLGRQHPGARAARGARRSPDPRSGERCARRGRPRRCVGRRPPRLAGRTSASGREHAGATGPRPAGSPGCGGDRGAPGPCAGLGVGARRPPAGRGATGPVGR